MTITGPVSASTPADGEATTQKVLFIGGLGRSGSTLVEKLLNELPQTFAVGETIHLWERGVSNQERCGCGEPFLTCPQWSAVGREAFGGWGEVDLAHIIGLRWSVDRTRQLCEIGLAHRNGRRSAAQAQYLYHLRRVLLSAAEVAGRPEVLIESSKHLSTASLLALDETIDLRVVHLVRDPRGVAYSWTKEIERPEADDELMPIYNPARTASRWVTDNLGFEALARRVPTLRLRYEDFLTDPARALTDIAHLADIESDELELGFLHGDTATLSTPMHSVAGNPMRFGGSEMKLRLDDAWKTKLDVKHKRLVTAITAPLLASYGYPLRG